MKTYQEQNWSESHGDEYVDRNPQTVKEMDQYYLDNFSIKRTDLNKEFLGDLKKDAKILEVGCNVGVQLKTLKEMGFSNLYGIEINKKAIEIAKQEGIDVIYASALDIPFKDDYFDLVFTAGVLIHISPNDIEKVMSEIKRCSNNLIWGFEYFSEEYKEIPYRGKDNMLWKANFVKLYNLEILKEKKLKYKNDDNVDSMFLLKK